MKTYQVRYTVNEGPKKGETLTVLVQGIDEDDMKKRFDRITDIMRPHYSENYEAKIVMYDEIESKSRLKRLESQIAADNLSA